MHPLPDSWTFNGNLDKPTFAPSFKHSGHHFEKRSDNSVAFVCHYVLTDGILNFCTDSTHGLAGKSVPLPKLPEGLTDEAA